MVDLQTRSAFEARGHRLELRGDHVSIGQTRQGGSSAAHHRGARRSLRLSTEISPAGGLFRGVSDLVSAVASAVHLDGTLENHPRPTKGGGRGTAHGGVAGNPRIPPRSLPPRGWPLCLRFGFSQNFSGCSSRTAMWWGLRRSACRSERDVIFSRGRRRAR